MTTTISPRAFTKIIFHATKYPHCSVNGLLLADKENAKTKSIVIADAYPLGHLCLNVSPMSEIFLVQAESFAEKENLQIVGYYAAAENFYDNTISKAPMSKIADKIAENTSNALFIMLDNQNLSMQMTKCPLHLWQSVGGRWTKAQLKIEQSKETLEAVSSLLKLGVMHELYDFDNYLDNPSKDWLNKDLNLDLNKILSMF